MTSALAIYRRWRDAINTSDRATHARDHAARDGAELLRGNDRPERPRRSHVHFRGGAILRTRRRPRVRPVGGPVPIRGTPAANAVAAAATQRTTATSSPWVPAHRASKKKKKKVLPLSPGSTGLNTPHRRGVVVSDFPPNRDRENFFYYSVVFFLRV